MIQRDHVSFSTKLDLHIDKWHICDLSKWLWETWAFWCHQTDVKILMGCAHDAHKALPFGRCHTLSRSLIWSSVKLESRLVTIFRIRLYWNLKISGNKEWRGLPFFTCQSGRGQNALRWSWGGHVTCPGRKEGAMQMLLRKSIIVYRKFSCTFITNWGNTLCTGRCCQEKPLCPVWS